MLTAIKNSVRQGRDVLLLALVVAALALGACGEESTDGGGSGEEAAQQAPLAKPKPKCRKAPKVVVKALEESLSAQGGGQLKRARAVRVADPPDAPLNGFKAGVYVVSGQLLAPGVEGEVLSWLVSRDMLNTGGGLAFGADSVTREFSTLGTAAEPGSPAGDYIDAIRGTPAYDQSRTCAQG